MKTILWFLSSLLMAGLALAEAPKPPAADRVHVRNVGLGDVLRPRNADGADGVPIVLYSLTTWKCLTWKMESADGKTTTFKNYFTSKSFAPDDKGNVTQVPLDKGVKWTVESAGEGKWKIVEPGGKRCLTATASGITVTPWTGDKNQQWELLPGPEKFSM